MSGARISPEVSALLDRRRLLERKQAEGIPKRYTLSADGKPRRPDPLEGYRGRVERPIDAEMAYVNRLERRHIP